MCWEDRTCFGTPSEIKGIMRLFHNGRTDTGKLGGTTVDRGTALLLDPDNTNAAWKQSTLPWPLEIGSKKEHILLYIYISHNIWQFCNLLNAFSMLQKLDQAPETTNTRKVPSSVLPSPSFVLSFFFLFFPSELAARLLPWHSHPEGIQTAGWASRSKRSLKGIQ